MDVVSHSAVEVTEVSVEMVFDAMSFHGSLSPSPKRECPPRSGDTLAKIDYPKQSKFLRNNIESREGLNG